MENFEENLPKRKPFGTQRNPVRDGSKENELKISEKFNEYFVGSINDIIESIPKQNGYELDIIEVKNKLTVKSFIARKYSYNYVTINININKTVKCF